MAPVIDIDDSWLEDLEPAQPVQESARQREIEALRRELCDAGREMERLREALAEKDALLAALALRAEHPVAEVSTAATSTASIEKSPALMAPQPPVLRQLSLSSVVGESMAPPESQDGERRTNPRRAYEQLVEFVAESHFFAGLTQDISTGGLFVATYNLLPVGTELTIQLELADGSELATRGVVRWVRREPNLDSERPGIGIAFTNLSADDLARINNFCQERPPLYIEL